MAYRSIFICIILVTITRDISAIKCWRCTSNLKFCGDVLDHTNLTENELRWYLVPCSSVRKKLDYKGDKMISKCNIRINLAYDKLIYTRQCVEEAETANLNSCLTDEVFNVKDNPNVQLMSCETCTEDGCNFQINNYFTTGIEPSISSFGSISKFIESKSMMLCLIIILICSSCNI